MEAIEARDIFKYLILKEEANKEERTRILRNITIFASKVPYNIFKNEYYVLYEAIVKAKKYNTVLTYEQLYQIIINNINTLVNGPGINPIDFSENPSNLNTVKEELAELCVVTYEELKNEPTEEDGEMKLNIELYIRSWAEDAVKEILVDMHTITSNGMKIKGKFRQGIEEANSYYIEEYGRIKQMIFEEVNELSNVIRTDKMTYEDLNKKRTEDFLSRTVSYTGIDGIDTIIGNFRKGDMVSILGQPGAGKTRFTASIMYNCLKEGNNVLWYPLEGNDMQAFCLIVARHIVEKYGIISDLDDKSVYENSFEEKYAEIVDTAILDILRNENLGRLQIRNIPLYDDEVFLELEAIWEDGFHFDALCIDYVSLIMSKNNEMAQAYLSRLLKKLKTTCMSFKNEGFLLLTPHQLTKEAIVALLKGEDTTIVGASDTTEVIKSSDIVFSLVRTEEQKIRDMISIYFTKTRFAKSAAPIEVIALHGGCYFADKPED